MPGLSRKQAVVSEGEDRDPIRSLLTECNRCGNCLFACPVYQTCHREPDSPRGKLHIIQALLEDRLTPGSASRGILFHCLLCGSCQYICPREVDFKKMMIRYRVRFNQQCRVPLLKRLFFRLYHRPVLHFGAWLVNGLRKTRLRRRFLIPAIRREGRRIPRAVPGREYDVLIFPGCGLDIFNQDILLKITRFLAGRGYRTGVLREAACCGFPALSQGLIRRFERQRDRNCARLDRYRFRYLVVPCGSGTYTFKNYYPSRYPVWELTEFIYRHLPDTAIHPRYLEKGRRYSYHDPCHHLKSLGLGHPPRHFLSRLGDRFVDNREETCCGFGGLFSIFFRKTAGQILKRKVAEFQKLGCREVFTACPGCYLFLKEQEDLRTRHFIELFVPGKDDRRRSGGFANHRE